MQFRLRSSECGPRRRLVTGSDRHLDLLDEGAHPAFAGAVDRGAFRGLPKPLFCRFVGSHGRSLRVGGNYPSAAAAASTAGPAERAAADPTGTARLSGF
jgi:hypothetical protein